MDESKLRSIRRQVEYYFSEKSYPKDRHLQSLQDPEGYIEIATISKFKRIEALGGTPILLALAIHSSRVLQLNADGTRVRGLHCAAMQNRPPDAPPLPVPPAYYLAANLQPPEMSIYKAAGVLPYRITPDKRMLVLMGLEPRMDRRTGHVNVCLCLLGGQRDLSDKDAAHTAAREFYEETGRLLKINITQALRGDGEYEGKQQVLWSPTGKYALFLYNITHDFDIHERYAAMQNRPAHSEMNSLHWIDFANFQKKEKTFRAEDGKEVIINDFFFGLVTYPSIVEYLSQRLN